MDNNQLKQIKNRIAALPSIEKRLNNMVYRLKYAKNDRDKLLTNMKVNLSDVENLQKESFSVYLLKLIKKYEGKFEKEQREYIESKIAYDKASELVKSLEGECRELEKNILALKEEKSLYENEIKNREKVFIEGLTGNIANRYKALGKEHDKCIRDLVEVKEALTAAEKVMDTIANVLHHLHDANSWSTLDIWGGGIFTDMAKYERLDKAQADMNMLSNQVWQLQKEFKDIGEKFYLEDIGVDSLTRAIDFWCDNIFTDIQVKNKINEDLDKVDIFRDRVGNLLNELSVKKDALEDRIIKIENEQEGIIIDL